MPPTKQRSADYRRAQAARKEKERGQKKDRKTEAYDRNKRNASKVRVRDWQDWD